jgi:hypothetical protein
MMPTKKMIADNLKLCQIGKTGIIHD